MVEFKMTKIEVRLAEKDEVVEWDSLVEASLYGTIFHTWKWLKIMEKHTKSKLYPFIGLRGDLTIGIFPLFYQKKGFVKAVFSPPPHLAVPYLGPVLTYSNQTRQNKKISIFREFPKQVDDFIFSELTPNYVLIRLPEGPIDSRPFKWTGYQVEPEYNYIFDLTKGEDMLFKNFRKDLRQTITRTSKRGVLVKEGSLEELIFIYNSLVKRYKEQNKIFYLSKEYLIDIYNSFYPQNLKIFAALCDGKLCGGAVTLCYKNKIISWLGSAKTDISGTSPNDLAQWEAMKWACKHGFRYYEEIGANTQRLDYFKSKYSPNLSIYFSAKKYSFMAKLAETAYFKVLKPMHTRLNSRRG
jgi:hypothetical protein